MTGGAREIRWAAWRIEADGSVRVVLTLGAGNGLEREERRFPTLEAASQELGESFGEVVGRAVAGGHRRGRWRP